MEYKNFVFACLLFYLKTLDEHTKSRKKQSVDVHWKFLLRREIISSNWRRGTTQSEMRNHYQLKLNNS